jgi:hypothetical protein
LTISFISESVTEIQNRYMHIFEYVSFSNAVSELYIHMTRILLILKSLMQKCIIVQRSNRQYAGIEPRTVATSDWQSDTRLDLIHHTKKLQTCKIMLAPFLFSCIILYQMVKAFF